MKCSTCGKENSDYVSFCESCGSTLLQKPSRQDEQTASTGFSKTPNVAEYYDLMSKKLSGIRITADRILLVEKKQVTMSFSRDKINSLELRNGFTAKRPLVQILFAAVLLASCFFPLRGIFVWLFMGGFVSLKVTILMLVGLGPLGTWLLVDGLRRGYFLQVEQEGKIHKLPFARKTRRSSVEEFLSIISKRFGYEVQKLGN